MLMSEVARYNAPVPDGRENQGTGKGSRRRRAVHYPGFRGRPLCVDADRPSWQLTDDRARCTCRRCLHTMHNDPFARYASPDVGSFRYRRALQQLGMPPDIDDPPPLHVLETLLDLKRRGMLTRELMEGVAEAARQYAREHGLEFRIGPPE